MVSVYGAQDFASGTPKPKHRNPDLQDHHIYRLSCLPCCYPSFAILMIHKYLSRSRGTMPFLRSIETNFYGGTRSGSLHQQSPLLPFWPLVVKKWMTGFQGSRNLSSSSSGQPPCWGGMLALRETVFLVSIYYLFVIYDRLVVPLESEAEDQSSIPANFTCQLTTTQR